jgi:predicted polyphosphate/ATP-dependent NAD kinase
VKRHRVGFVVNPIAGMGGRVGLKGTDDVADLARSLGAEPVAPRRAAEMLAALGRILQRGDGAPSIHWLTASGEMGEHALRAAGITCVEVTFSAGSATARADTRRAAASFVAAGAELVVFCGGDGTARDVSAGVARRAPMIGVPAGVKMYSGVFGVNPASTAEIVAAFLDGALTVAEADVLDLDEEAYRRGEWVVRLCDAALTPQEPTRVQSAKVSTVEADDRAAQDAIAEHLLERIEDDPGALWLLGPGTTVAAVARRLGVEKSLLGVDAVQGGRVIERDPNERALLALLDRSVRPRLVLSPIGAQGFVLGRGNQQLSPAVVRRIGPEAIVLVATPAKLARTPVLRFDTGDPALDAALAAAGFWAVVTGYHRRRLVPVADERRAQPEGPDPERRNP